MNAMSSTGACMSNSQTFADAQQAEREAADLHDEFFETDAPRATGFTGTRCLCRWLML